MGLTSAGLFPLLGILETIEDLGFVFKIIVFAYMIFWLYMNLRDSPIIFAVGSIIAAFFILIQPLPTIVLVIIFVVFNTLGMHLQFLLQFGLFPLARFFGIEMEHPEWAEQQRMQGIEQKLKAGMDLSYEEEQYLEKMQKRELEYQKKMQQKMVRYGGGM